MAAQRGKERVMTVSRREMLVGLCGVTGIEAVCSAPRAGELPQHSVGMVQRARFEWINLRQGLGKLRLDSGWSAILRYGEDAAGQVVSGPSESRLREALRLWAMEDVDIRTFGQFERQGQPAWRVASVQVGQQRALEWPAILYPS